MIYRKDEWLLRRTDRRYDSLPWCDVDLTSLLWLEFLFPCWWNSEGWFLFGGSVFRQLTELRKSLCLHLLFFKCLQHQIIHMSKWPFWGWHIRSCSTFVTRDSDSVCSSAHVSVPPSLNFRELWEVTWGKRPGNQTEESNEKQIPSWSS